jgi:hypothetical protein
VFGVDWFLLVGPADIQGCVAVHAHPVDFTPSKPNPSRRVRKLSIVALVAGRAFAPVSQVQGWPADAARWRPGTACSQQSCHGCAAARQGGCAAHSRAPRPRHARGPTHSLHLSACPGMPEARVWRRLFWRARGRARSGLPSRASRVTRLPRAVIIPRVPCQSCYILGFLGGLCCRLRCC